MRLFKKLMMAVAAVPLFTACMDNSNTYSAIFGVSANGGSPVFANTGHAFATLGSFGSWHIEQNSGSDWCSLDMMRGAGNAYYSIPARFKLNTTDLYRVASFTARDDENPDDVYATITFRQYGTRIDGSLGSAALVTGITGDDGTEIKTSALFVFVGIEPNTEAVKDIVETDGGFIRTDGEMRTSLPGFFAAGDVRTTPFRQVVTAAGDGAVAAHSADHYIQNL